MYYNPYTGSSAQQMQLNQLMQQKQLLENQINMLTQPPQQPANVNVNVQPNQQPQQQPNFMNNSGSYDAGVVYVDTYDDAKKAAAGTIPIMYMEKDQPFLHFKTPDGNIQTYKLEPVQVNENPAESALQTQVNDLQSKMDAILAALTTPQTAQAQAVQEKPKPQTAAKKQQPGKES